MDNDFFTSFLNFFKQLPRLGPGDDLYTREIYKILSLKNPKIIDMGCGKGQQTIVLAKEGADITAIDLFDMVFPFLMEKAEKENVTDKIKTITCSMDDIPKMPKDVDVIWAEGSANLIGLSNALKLWKDLLKDGGFIVLSELTWFTEKIEPELHAYWDEAYPEMKQLSETEDLIKESGYKWIGSIRLPKNAWDEYYNPQRELIKKIKPDADDSMLSVITKIENEIRTFDKFFDKYGYVYYIMQK